MDDGSYVNMDQVKRIFIEPYDAGRGDPIYWIVFVIDDGKDCYLYKGFDRATDAQSYLDTVVCHWSSS